MALSLPQGFKAAHELYTKMSEADRDGVLTDEQLPRLTQTLLSVADLVQRAALFSSNELLEDINTTDLKYLLVPFMLGEAYFKWADQNSKEEHLKRAKVCFTGFMEHCRQIGVGAGEDFEAYMREAPLDPGARRTDKIARMKRGRELDAKLKALSQRKHKESEMEEEGLKWFADEETEREFVITWLQSCVRQTVEYLEQLEQEMEMLQHSLRIKRGDIPDPRSDPAARQPPRPMKVVTINNPRELYKAQVFADVTKWLQLMELDEINRAEQAMAMMAKSTPTIEEQVDSEDESVIDAKQLKARNWDDWKDDHPKGDGNKMR
eukprot:GILK01006300.1.p1 GENE.GILK01006300.1~~GILK01006300.1.p1  ORF type:complete len:334 (+),score=65.21 GILK01006300.1:42-1004(+)